MLSSFLPVTLFDRPLPGSDGSLPASTDGTMDSFNLIFIVGFAVLITVLARWLSTRGRRK